MTFVAGVDLGQAADYTAIVVTQVLDDHLDVRHIQRLPLGTPYPAQVSTIARMMSTAPLGPSTTVAVDATGVGRAVVDLLRPLPFRLLPVTITGGASASRGAQGWHVPKRDLITATQVSLQQGRLRIAAGLPMAKELITELAAYRVSLASSSGNESWANDWRMAPHDDLVLALCIAVWAASRSMFPMRSSATPLRQVIPTHRPTASASR